MQHRNVDLIGIFNRLFAETEATILVSGGDEPFYRPSPGQGQHAQVVFARGYFASALHEVAHWCIAGSQRRTLPDYGYWYVPDGRSESEQQAFTQVEIKPQAMEWLFSIASGTDFHFSADNLADGGSATDPSWIDFQTKVAAQARYYAITGLPERAKRFADALSDFYHTGPSWCDPENYSLDHSADFVTTECLTASLHGGGGAAKTA